ncbi:MAG: hypothetical protein U0271_06255 [Polyangiaceae bacterium]
MQSRSFDVICAGHTEWSVVAPRASEERLRLLPSDGAIRSALLLSNMSGALGSTGERPLRVGLATNLQDDSLGRRLTEHLTNAGIDTTGVSFERSFSGVVLLEARLDAPRVVDTHIAAAPISIPEEWRARVLLLSGLAPSVAYNASLCKAARAARRRGAAVVVEVAATFHAWAGADSRAARAVLANADVVCCTSEDLAILGESALSLRSWMRPEAAFVLHAVGEPPMVTGRFGVVRGRGQKEAQLLGTPLAASICRELSMSRDVFDVPPDLYRRALDSSGG